MAGTTISSSITTGVSLTSTSQNPVSITTSGTINAAGTGSGADAIYAAFGTPGTIINAGLLEAPNGYGIFLKSAGRITNPSPTLARSPAPEQLAAWACRRSGTPA
jgi:hypothetical protein